MDSHSGKAQEASVARGARVVLAGGSTPMVRVLERLGNRTFPGIVFAAVYSDGKEDGEIAELTRSLGIKMYALDLLGGADAPQQLGTHCPDWLLNINSTLIYGGELLQVPARGALNLHPGLLPEYAGLHCHQWAIRNGAHQFGATLHWMVPQIDAGPLALQSVFPILPRDTGLSLFVKCLNSGADLAMKALEMIANGQKLPKVDQNITRRTVYRHKDALDGRICWNESARRITDFVRAADYRPFSCPTYRPEARLEGQVILVRKAVEVSAREISAVFEDVPLPGHIVDVTPDGLLVATGQGMIRLVALSTDQTKMLKGEKLAQAMAWAKGKRFELVGKSAA